jgi:predicted permease
MIPATWQDTRYTLRALRTNPMFTAIAVLSLALGIGANTAIFSILNALMLRELPVWRPERLVEISGVYRNGSEVPFSFPMFEEIEHRQRAFSGVFAWTAGSEANVEVNGAPLLATKRAVTGNYYSELRVSPLLGRLLTANDTHGTKADPVAVLSYSFWQRQFGSDPAIIGKTLRLEGHVFTIVGVTRKWFAGMTTGTPPDVTVLIGAPGSEAITNPAVLWLFVTGRLKENATIEQAHAQMQSFWHDALLATVPTQTAGRRRNSYLAMRLKMQPGTNGVNKTLRSHFLRPLYLLLAIGGLILIVVCISVANLMLARAASRGHEIGTRLALGANAWQISRQLLVESAMLSLAGTLLALVFAWWTSRFLTAFMTSGSLKPTLLDLRPDGRVFLFAAAIALATALLVGLAPAWQASRQGLAFLLRRNDRAISGGTGMLGKALIVAQVALSVVLLHGAALFLRSLDSLRSFDPGFRRTGVLEVGLYPKPNGFDHVNVDEYRRELAERITHLPGVFSAAFSDISIPAGGLGWNDTVSLATSEPDPTALTTLVVVSPDFFNTLGIPLLSGRDFDWTDDEHHPPVAIVDDSLAQRLGTSNPIVGRRVRFGVQPPLQNLTVIGIAHRARIVDLKNSGTPVLYVPATQQADFGYTAHLFVRTSEPAALAATISNIVQPFGHEYPVSTKTVEAVTDQSLVRERATAMLSSFYAAVALLLAGFGLFGLMSHTVTRRTREIGIRLALGSPNAQIIRTVLREMILLIVAGILLGVPCALLVARFAKHMLFGLSPYDLATLTAVSLLLLAVGGIAGYWPALRATKVDPMVALRHL